MGVMGDFAEQVINLPEAAQHAYWVVHADGKMLCQRCGQVDTLHPFSLDNVMSHMANFLGVHSRCQLSPSTQARETLEFARGVLQDALDNDGKLRHNGVALSTISNIDKVISESGNGEGTKESD